MGVGLKAGTLGLGVDVSVALTKTINARIALTSVEIDSQNETVTVGDAGSEGDIDAVLDADYGANALLVDWYVFNGTFHVTAGMVKNNGKADFRGTLLSNVVIDGDPLSPSDLVGGSVGGQFSLGDSYQPYLGVGWGRKASSDPGLAFSVEIGVALLDPDAQLRATLDPGSINYANQPELQQTLDNAEADVEADLDEFELFPVLSFGVNYAF
ncbi:MAG: hypothetical protein OEN02_15680 [Gammaproteobacteria bacterium]|nr:hypothetical protein [Gammaproteobacteria bacterium]